MQKRPLSPSATNAQFLGYSVGSEPEMVFYANTKDCFQRISDAVQRLFSVNL